ncbi:hypothetical protein EJ03DRAFT_77691 [Teratosphaeria nubilosa]|uniref:Uncharacterized protein n=1 Tax=Teratosphaeria nubilosa TaxID=161662 RepID=A0A6G1LBE1_9PEZI|nr:hypothetical protein EJ03DRAFT_77691 [Teratosphaeria nubilosa]
MMRPGNPSARCGLEESCTVLPSDLAVKFTHIESRLVENPGCRQPADDLREGSRMSKPRTLLYRRNPLDRCISLHVCNSLVFCPVSLRLNTGDSPRKRGGNAPCCNKATPYPTHREQIYQEDVVSMHAISDHEIIGQNMAAIELCTLESGLQDCMNGLNSRQAGQEILESNT